MDDAQFDGWTRRQFGRAGGGWLAALLGLAGAGAPVSAKPKHRRRHKRQKRHDPACCGAAGAECGTEATADCGCCEGLSCVFILGASVGHCVMVV